MKHMLNQLQTSEGAKKSFRAPQFTVHKLARVTFDTSLDETFCEAENPEDCE